MPKVDLKAKFAAMNDKVKKARMPSPHELRDGYLNSSFHKSFHQPLAVRSREMDDPEELEQRQVRSDFSIEFRFGLQKHSTCQKCS